MLKPALALFALLASATPALAQTITPDEQSRIDKLVIETLAKTKTPSASIAIVRGGEIVLAKAYGKAAESIPVSNSPLPSLSAARGAQKLAIR